MKLTEDIRKMMKLVIKIRDIDGNRLSGQLIDIVDDRYIKIRFRTGLEALISINDIAFIAPIKNQPAEVI